MCITEDKLVDCYETGLFNRILFEVEYNRRKKNDDDLGVRIQTSHRSEKCRKQRRTGCTGKGCCSRSGEKG